jgi:hypothetical protein
MRRQCFVSSSLSERTVILRSEGGEAAEATKNLIVGALIIQKVDSSAPPGPQNDETGDVLPLRFSLRQTASILCLG